MSMILKNIEILRGKLTSIQPLLLWLVGAWFAYRLIVNGIRKFDPDGFWGPAFDEWGYPVWFLFLIGFLETTGGLALLIPKFRHFGGLILAVIMLGAFFTRLIHGVGLDDALSIAHFFIIFLYLSTYLRKS